MNSEREPVISVTAVIGFLLLIPAFISIFIFIGAIIDPRTFMVRMAIANNGMYIGLLAIAGAYLIKRNNLI